MINWKTTSPKPPLPCSVLDIAPVHLSVNSPDDGKRQWQHLCISFGKYSEDDHGECLKTWPREALRLAREKLDRFESTLDGEN